MEQEFGKNSIDIEALREFCEREGKEVTYRKGDQLEREGDPALTTIKAMMPSRMLRVSGEQLVDFSVKTLKRWSCAVSVPSMC